MILSAKTYASYYDLQLLIFIGFNLLDWVSLVKSGFSNSCFVKILIRGWKRRWRTNSFAFGFLPHFAFGVGNSSQLKLAWHRQRLRFISCGHIPHALLSLYINHIYIYMVYTYSTCIRLVPCIVGGQKWFPMMNMIFLINTSRVRLVGPCLHTPSPNLTRNGDFWGGSFGQFVHEYVCKYVNACVYMYIYTCKLTDFDNQASLFLCRIWWSPWGSNWFQVASHVTSAAKGMLATPPRNSKFKGKWKPPGGQCYKMGELLKKIAIENLCLSW